MAVPALPARLGGVKQGESLLRVVTIGSGQLNDERNPSSPKQYEKDGFLTLEFLRTNMLEIILALSSQDREISQFSDFLSQNSRSQGRYCSLQGIAERPLPCNYNVIRPLRALSRW